MACVPQNYPVGVERCIAEPVYVCNFEAITEPIVTELTTLLESGVMQQETWILRSTVADVNDPLAYYHRHLYSDGTVIWTDDQGAIIAAPAPGVDEEIIPQRGNGGVRAMYEAIAGEIVGFTWDMPDSVLFKINKIWINVITVGDVGAPPTLTTGNGAFPLFAGQVLEFFIDGVDQSLTNVFTITTGHADDVISIYWTEEDR